MFLRTHQTLINVYLNIILFFLLNNLKKRLNAPLSLCMCLKNGLLRVNQDQLRQKKHNFFPFLWTPLSWLIEKHFLSAKIKSWQDGQPGSALVWFLAQAITSPLLFNNGGEILITVLSELILCAGGKEKRKTEKPISNEAVPAQC